MISKDTNYLKNTVLNEIAMTISESDCSQPTKLIGDTVWVDLNQNGIQDNGEPGMGNVTVDLYNYNNKTKVATTTTNANGNYIFDTVYPGTYYVIFSNIPEGYGFIQSNGVVDTTGRTQPFCVKYDDDPTDNTNIDAPILPAIVTTTTTPVPVTTTTTPVPVTTTTTPVPVTTTTTTVPVTTTTTTVPVTTTTTTVPVTTTTTSSGLASVSGTIWVDLNQDGTQAPTEPGYPGAFVTLYNCNTNDPIQSVYTDSLGNYSFNNLAPNIAYYIKVDPIPGYKFIQSNGVADTNGRTNCFRLNPGENRVDLDIPILPVCIQTICPVRTTTTTTTTTTSPVPGSITGIVFADYNCNGVIDTEDIGVPNVFVSLYNANTYCVVSTVLTNSNGNYQFSNVNPGNYYLIFNNIPCQYSFNTKTGVVSRNGKTDVFTLCPGQNITNLNVGLCPNCVNNNTSNSSCGCIEDDNYDYPSSDNCNNNDIIPYELGTVGGYVWLDSNGDGCKSSREMGIPNVDVSLYDCNNQLIDSTTTSRKGKYIFNNVPSGSYYIQFGDLPCNYVYIKSNHLVNSNGLSLVFNLCPGESRLDVNAPVYRKPNGHSCINSNSCHDCC
ncbi:Serine-aspartate repeat-containing protein D precursor [uncultured Clostridium sp.]|nr:Serine-aspartate repeat-containing protein D precursor [uncultured Clostridium sp.]